VTKTKSLSPAEGLESAINKVLRKWLGVKGAPKDEFEKEAKEIAKLCEKHYARLHLHGRRVVCGACGTIIRTRFPYCHCDAKELRANLAEAEKKVSLYLAHAAESQRAARKIEARLKGRSVSARIVASTSRPGAVSLRGMNGEGPHSTLVAAGFKPGDIILMVKAEAKKPYKGRVKKTKWTKEQEEALNDMLADANGVIDPGDCAP